MFLKKKREVRKTETKGAAIPKEYTKGVNGTSRKMMQEKQKDMQVYKENPEIVGIVKPVGKWTKMVMISGGLMQRLVAQLIKIEGDKKGFWELFLKAQASTKGKCKGKCR